MGTNAAQFLWDARLNNNVIPRDFDGYPTTEADAYAIQMDMIAGASETLVGWKLGATVAAALPLIGIEQPFIGPLFARFCHEDGATLPALPGQALETEFTVRLECDLPNCPDPYRKEELEAVIGALVPSFEVIGLRFDGGVPGAGYRPIADGGINVATVLGKDVTEWDTKKIGAHAVHLNVNGTHVATGKPADLIWEHLIDAIGWLAKHPHLAERGLRAGDLIMTGSMTGMIPIQPGDQAEADFGAFGKIRAQFT
jgi:2-keto-4-pentenoate hydratase